MSSTKPDIVIVYICAPACHLEQFSNRCQCLFKGSVYYLVLPITSGHYSRAVTIKGVAFNQVNTVSPVCVCACVCVCVCVCVYLSVSIIMYI